MYHRIRNFLVPPTLENQSEALVATLLNTSLLVVFGVALVVPPLLFLVTPAGERNGLVLVLGGIMAAVTGGLWFLMRRGRIELASVLFSATLLVILTLITFRFGGVRNTTTAAFVLVIILAILLLKRRIASFLFTAFSVLALAGAYYAEVQGMIVLPQRAVGIVDFIIYATIFALVGSLLRFAVRNLDLALARAWSSEQAAAVANRQLQGLNLELEDRVAARTQALVTSAEIGRYVSTILDRQRLVKEVADEIRDAFNYYQVHVYLLNEKDNILELAAGAGHAGAELVARRHSVPVEKGLVGRAVRTNEAVLAPDVTQVESWLPNPLLPDTQSEVTVPIAVGEKVLGVLDIQQNRVNALGQSDADLLMSISGQVAVALENARLLSQAQARAAQEALINQISQQIQSAATIESALQIAVREVGRAIDAPHTRVRLSGNATLPAEPGNGRAEHKESTP